MKKYHRLVLCVVCIISVFSVNNSGLLRAQHQKEVIPSSGEPKSEGARILSKFKFTPLDFNPPKAERLVLENGMILYLLEDHDLPIINMTAQIRTGAVYEPMEKAGLASLTGEVIRSGGTKSMPPDKMNEELEFMAASVETSIGRESGSASLSVLKKDLDKGLKIFADILRNPAFPEDKIRMKKDEAIESIRRENDRPQQIAGREFRKIIYENIHPYSRRVDGTLESIEKITRKDMIAFHKNFFRPNNIILGISGDFDKKTMIEKLNEVFKGWKKEDIDFPEVPKVKNELNKSVNYVSKDINQANVIMGHLGIHRKSPDYFPIEIMNFILGGSGFTARITSRIRSDEGLAYSAFSNFQTSQDLGIFYVMCQTKLNSTHRAISIALEEIEKMRSTLVDNEELMHAKETIVNQFVFRFTTSASIVAQMVDIEYEGLPLDYLETYVDNIQAVTIEDIQRVAKKYLHPDKISILVVGNKDKFDKPLDTFGKVNEIALEQYPEIPVNKTKNEAK
ncbi:MAG: insulinase family protein [Candidatus Kuenenia sp.]|nr:insulinase family protein [Candidatus Kuenenia hertensis]